MGSWALLHINTSPYALDINILPGGPSGSDYLWMWKITQGSGAPLHRGFFTFSSLGFYYYFGGWDRTFGEGWVTWGKKGGTKGAEEEGGGEGVGEREQGGWCFLNFHSLHKPNTQTQAFLHTHTHLSEHAIHLARYTWPKVHIAEEVLSDWVGGRELGCGQIRAYWGVGTTGEVTGD